MPRPTKRTRGIRPSHSMSSLPPTRPEKEVLNNTSPLTDNGITTALMTNLRFLPGLDQPQTETLASAVSHVISHATGVELKLETLVEMVKKHVLKLPIQTFQLATQWIKENPKLFWFIALALVGGFPRAPALVIQLIAGVASSGITSGHPLGSQLTTDIIHSAIGNVAAGSVSSILQSLGIPGAMAKAASAGVTVAVPALVDLIGQELDKFGLGKAFESILKPRSRL